MCDGNHRLTRQIFRHREIEVLEMILLGLAWVPLGVEWTIVDYRRRSPLVRLVAPGLARVNRYEDRHLLERAEGLLQNWVSLGMDRQGDLGIRTSCSSSTVKLSPTLIDWPAVGAWM